MKRAVSVCTALLTLCMTAPQLSAPAYAAESTVSAMPDTDSSVPDFSCFGAVGTLTEEESRKTAEAVYRALQAHSTQVSLKGIGIDLTNDNANDIYHICYTVMGGWDVGILAVKNKISYNTYFDRVNLNYRFEGDEYDAQYAAYSQKLDDILSGVKPEWSDVEKALYLHDYISIYYDYDSEAFYGTVERENSEHHCAYGMLKNGVAVCDGYSDLYQILLHRLGIDALSVISEELRHGWNIVRIDGDWYYVDVTWDDVYSQDAGKVLHENFLRTADEMIQTEHTASDWSIVASTNICDLAVPDTFGNAFWLESDSAILPWRNAWLTVGKDSPCTLSLHTNIRPDGTSDRTELLTLEYDDYKWPVWDMPGYTWRGNYVSPAVIGDILFYSTPTVIYALQDNSPVPVYELSDAEKEVGYIYGLYADGDTLYYGISTESRTHQGTLDYPILYDALTAGEWSTKLPVPEPDYDLNGDSTVSVQDAVALAKYLNETVPESDFREESADLNCDNLITLADLSVLLSALMQ